MTAGSAPPRRIDRARRRHHDLDRAKDVIKSGGEWISSVDLENIADGPSRCSRLP